MNLRREFIDLSMKAKGKADLYFHAYFWQEYLTCLDNIQEKASSDASSMRMSAESSSAKVDLIKADQSKYPFM